MRVDFDHRLWQVYTQGRTLPAAAVAAWLDAVARHAGTRRPLTVLDLGSGTGRFTPALADRFGGPVYGVEPAAKMRGVAVASSAHPAVGYLAGRAEEIPLPDASCDLAFLFFVVHHFEDRRRAGRELARVLKPSATVCVRTLFGDRLRDVGWRRHFPRALELEQSLFPSFGETTAMFTDEGFDVVAVEEIEFELAASPAEHLERLRHRAISTFELLTDEEVEAGLAALEREVAAATVAPVVEIGDLLVLRRRTTD